MDNNLMFIPAKDNIRTITDMREDALKLLTEVKKRGFLYLFHHSDPKAVVLSLEEFQRLHDLVEDHIDEKEAEILSFEKRGRGTPLKKILKEARKKTRV